MYTITGKCIHVPSKAIASGRHTYPHLPVSIIGKCMPQRWKSTIEIGSVSPLAAHFPQNWPMVFAKPKIERGEFSNQLWFGLFCTKIEPNGPFDLQAIEFVGNVHGASYCLNLGNGLPERQTGAPDANSPRQRTWNGSNERSLSMIVFYGARAEKEKKTWPHSWKWWMAGKRAKTRNFFVSIGRLFVPLFFFGMCITVWSLAKVKLDLFCIWIKSQCVFGSSIGFCCNLVNARLRFSGWESFRVIFLLSKLRMNAESVVLVLDVYLDMCNKKGAFVLLSKCICLQKAVS